MSPDTWVEITRNCQLLSLSIKWLKLGGGLSRWPVESFKPGKKKVLANVRLAMKCPDSVSCRFGSHCYQSTFCGLPNHPPDSTDASVYFTRSGNQSEACPQT